MLSTEELTEEQCALYAELWNAIIDDKDIEYIFKDESGNKKYKNEDVKAIFNRFCQKSDTSDIYITLPVHAVDYGNDKALIYILRVASNIEGLEEKIFKYTQYRKYEKGVIKAEVTLLGFARAREKSSAIDIIESRMEALDIPIPLTPEQSILLNDLFDAIGTEGKSVEDILKNQSDRDKKAVLTNFIMTDFTLTSFAVNCKNIQALEDIFNIASNIEGLKKKILKGVQYVGACGEYTKVKYTLLDCALTMDSDPVVLSMIDIIKKEMEKAGLPIPPEHKGSSAVDGALPSSVAERKSEVTIENGFEDQNAGPISTFSGSSINNNKEMDRDGSELPDNPSSLKKPRKHTGKILGAIGLGCLIGGAVLLTAGIIAFGIPLLFVSITLLILSIEKVRDKLYDVCTECFQSKSIYGINK